MVDRAVQASDKTLLILQPEKANKLMFKFDDDEPIHCGVMAEGGQDKDYD